MFSTSEVPVLQEIFQNMHFLSWSESMPLVARGGYAFISYRSALDFVVSTQYTDDNGETNLHVAFGTFFDGGNAWAFPKVSRQFTIGHIFIYLWVTADAQDPSLKQDSQGV